MHLQAAVGRRQEHLHREAGRRRWPRHPQGAGRLRRGQEEEPGHRRRHAAPPPDRLPRNDEAHPRRRHRRPHRRPLLLEPGQASGSKPRKARPGPTSTASCATGTTSSGCAATTSVEQHVHNLDVMQLGADRPIRCGCMGVGGRQVRTAPEYGHIFDHFAIDYEYPNGVHMLSMCRQIPGCDRAASPRRWSAPRALCQVNSYTFHRPRRTRTANRPARRNSASRQGQRSVRAGAHRPDREHPRRQADQRAEERGREHPDGDHGPDVGLHRQGVTWDKALNSQEDTLPAKLAWDMNLPVPPVAMPGKTKLV